MPEKKSTYFLLTKGQQQKLTPLKKQAAEACPNAFAVSAGREPDNRGIIIAQIWPETGRVACKFIESEIAKQVAALIQKAGY